MPVWLTNVMVDNPLHRVVLILRVEGEVRQGDREVLHWGKTVGAARGETVLARHVPLTQSDQVDGVGGGLNRETIMQNIVPGYNLHSSVQQ